MVMAKFNEYNRADDTGIWVLTEEHNAYDQFGEYFVHAWNSKPTGDQLREVIGIHGGDKFINHVLAGGGREKYEDSWYYLRCQD